MKVCKKCEVEKPLLDFPKAGRSSDGHSKLCKTCKDVPCIRRGYKYRLYPNKTQEKILYQIVGNNRKVWNEMLAIQSKNFQETGKFIFDNGNKNTEGTVRYYLEKIKNTCVNEETGEAYLDIGPAAALNKVVEKDLVPAIKLYLKARKDGKKVVNRKGKVSYFYKNRRVGFPKFHKKGKNDSFSWQYTTTPKTNHITIPNVGKVKFLKHRPLLGKTKEATVSVKNGKWYVSFSQEIEHTPTQTQERDACGIDMGCRTKGTLKKAVTIVDKDGHELFEYNSKLKQLERRLKIRQRRQSRKERLVKKGQKTSQNTLKSRKRVAVMHEKISNYRKDWQHKLSHQVASNYKKVVIEDLKVANMTHSAKGTTTNPGKNVKQKSGLNKSILDVGWFSLREKLNYKIEERSGQLILVDPSYTSQTCPGCGHIDENNRKAEQFCCVKCGYKNDADVVGAKNILTRGLEIA